jgi:hypothetical protein
MTSAMIGNDNPWITSFSKALATCSSHFSAGLHQLVVASLHHSTCLVKSGLGDCLGKSVVHPLAQYGIKLAKEWVFSHHESDLIKGPLLATKELG